MEGKITTYEEYEQCNKEKKEIRDTMFNLRLEIFMSKNDLDKTKLLENKYKLLKSKYAKIAVKLREYEIENNIEKKKEGKNK